MNTTLMIWPMVLMALTTLAIYFPMSAGRIKALKSGSATGADFKAGITEPEESRIFINAIRNQYETPVLFYAACLAAVATQADHLLMVALAWIYALVKFVHVFIHIANQNIRLRRRVFMVAYFVLIAMWLVLAASLLGIG